MRTFLEYLLEGGNVKVGEHEASPIDVTEHNREKHIKDISDMLHSIHDTFHAKTGNNLFGKNKKALSSGAAFSGSTKHFMDNSISHKDFSKHKSKVGDIDVKIPEEHHNDALNHLSVGSKHGKYTVVGTKKSGGEFHALMKHENGGVHQVDFEKAKYEKDEPSKFDKFAHSSDWEDVKAGIKGVHHKQLLNAVGGTTHKFSILHGLGKREGDPSWVKDPKHITKTLFGKDADENKIHSFKGVSELIKNHIPKERHEAILNKFKDSEKGSKGIDYSKAISHLKNKLEIK